MQYTRRSVEFRLLREHVTATHAYRHGLGQWFGGRMLDVFLLLSVSSGLRDGARDDYLKNMREYLDAVSDLVSPFNRQDAGLPQRRDMPGRRQATDEDRTRYLGLMAAGMHSAGKQGFTSLKELRQAMDALKETINHISSATAGDSK
ncbi:hypothetical protein [Desulfovibrio piger]|uniref:Uncharacterized protein n=1 Tax=Desulfovibrio piger TaxID=901 RepID=A0A848CL49_9BACT|nr:hypothetical protein [Desulfovibrio piger]NME53073.1 hypothetical protein [Desulfovibrio piger]